jgi:hypothetical protein
MNAPVSFTVAASSLLGVVVVHDATAMQARSRAIEERWPGVAMFMAELTW